MTDIRVYQGNQIGGCVTVITCTCKGETHRIMIDFGSSLPGSGVTEEFQYDWENKPVDAVFFTHYHGDHVGRITEIPPEIPIYMGSTARDAMITIQSALCKYEDEDVELHKKELALLKDEKRVRTFEWNGYRYKSVRDIPLFVVEPYSVDHSAYDAYMYLITTEDENKPDGKYVTLHTGDFRGHGWRGNSTLDVINHFVRRHGKRTVDALVIEGTMMNRSKEKVLTEFEMYLEATKYLREHKYAFLICSSTNLDSLASFYKAEQEAFDSNYSNLYVPSNYFVEQLDLFTKTAGSFTDLYKFEHVYRINLGLLLSHPNWGNKKKTQQELMEQHGFLAIIKPEDYCEEYIDAFIRAKEDGRIDQLPVIIYSMWDGYIKKGGKARVDSWIEFLDRQKEKGVKIKPLHTSGHASPQMIADVINAVDPQDEIIPMHTENPKGFETLPISEELKQRIRPSEE